MRQLLLKRFNKVNFHQAVNIIGSIIFLGYPFVYGFDSLWISAVIVGNIIGNCVTSGYYHRALSHKSWECPIILQYILMVFGAIFWMMPARLWVAIHREHHAHYDTNKDPHGPAAGLFRNIFLLYNTPKIKYLKYDATNVIMKWQMKNYFNIAFLSLIIGSIISIPFYFIIVGQHYVGQIVVNIFGHNGRLRNSHLLSIWLGGELYHEVHHTDQRKPRFGFFDLPYYMMIKWLR